MDNKDEKNVIKIGNFELQTKSFWLGLVSILVLFMTSFFFINTVFWYKINKEINETNKTLIKVINDHISLVNK